MNITIERATAQDAQAVLDFLKQIGGETDNLTFGAEGPPFSVEAEEAYIAGMEQSGDNLMLLAKLDGRVIGNATLHRQPRRMRHRGDFSVGVAKEHWNKGIGRRLLEEVIAFAKANEFAIIDLQVRSDNSGAIHLYEKYGFRKLCTYPEFFRINGEAVDFDYMVLRLE